ncbi:hypothetical protein B0X71_07835 [Planococcus lenghuensis]|uniref:Competence protein ComGF n=2 Tax=Planococcus lenghuensis TaxID=2213202 RepID=A0A1Q2L3T8_9BACL|nr:hypothetical protein B0X71_07835 [Planococcus lenghuensis]
MDTRQNGSTFIGLLLDLAILLLLLPLIVLFFRLAAAYSADLDVKHAEWELFTYELRTYLNTGSNVAVINGGKGIRMTESGTLLTIEWYSPIIRKQRSGQGHEVMLTDVQHVTFAIAGAVLTAQVVFRNGIRKEETYAIPPAPG